MSQFDPFQKKQIHLHVEEHIRTQRIRRYNVVLHNDNHTTMDFVIEVLQLFFGKNDLEALQIMLTVHTQGRGVAGVFVKDIAETKAAEVLRYASRHNMPLMITTEPE